MLKSIGIDAEKVIGWGYDDWLDFFRTYPANKLLASQEILKLLPTEGYAAASRWVEIITNPSKMDKLYQGRLKANKDTNIRELAVGDDDEAFYEALIMENVEQLNSSNTSAQETARITQNLNIFRRELRDIRSRRPKEGSVLSQVLKAALEPPKVPEKASKPSKVKKAAAKKATPKKTVVKKTTGKGKTNDEKENREPNAKD